MALSSGEMTCRNATSVCFRVVAPVAATRGERVAESTAEPPEIAPPVPVKRHRGEPGHTRTGIFSSLYETCSAIGPPFGALTRVSDTREFRLCETQRSTLFR